MRPATATLGRRPGIAFLVFTVVSTFGLAVWGLVNSEKLRSFSTDSRSDAASSAKQYITQRPIDSAGWIARAEAMYSVTRDAAAPSMIGAIAIAAKLAPVDPQVLRAQMLLALLRGDIATGLTLAADFATLFPTESREAFSTLRAYTNDVSWSPFFEKRLTAGWSGAESFLADSCQVGAPLATLLAIAQPIIRRQPLSESTVTCIGKKAIAENQVSAAYWLWINALATVPSPLGNVFNGDFERAPAERLFDWQLSAGGEYREGFAAAVRLDDSRGVRNNVLNIRFNGRSLKPPVAQQFLVLAPGRYTMSHHVREIALSAPGSVRWTVRCMPATLSVTLTDAVVQPAGNGWSFRQQELMIPPGCDGQLLDLDLGNRLQLAQGLRGTVLFDDVSIVRK